MPGPISKGMIQPCPQSFRRVTLPVVAGCILWSVSAFGSTVAFEYAPIADPIVSATFSADFASLTAHRTVGGMEANFVRLIDLATGLPNADLSDGLFGTAAYPNPPLVDMGPLETGIVSASIDPAFFPALTGGSVGLEALFTETGDGLFAIDFLSLAIQTTVGTVESFYGWPVGNENDGFGIAIPDGGLLPSPLPTSIPVGATGTGFDESISSKSIYLIPEPATLGLVGCGGLSLLLRRRR